MVNIIVVFPKLEDAKNIRNLLARNGYSVIGVCCTGAQVLQIIDNLEDGIRDVAPSRGLGDVYKRQGKRGAWNTHQPALYQGEKERMGRIFPPGFRMGTGSVSLPHINFPPEMDLDF